MLAEAEHPTTAAPDTAAVTHAARRADKTAKKAAPAANALPQVLSGWTPPAHWTPFATFAEAKAAYDASRVALGKACRARMAISGPFIKSGPASQTYHYTFSRSADEAVQRCPDLPDDLIAVTRGEEQARDFHEETRLRLTVTPAYGADILRKLRAITTQIDDVFDPEERSDVAEAFARPDEFPQTLEFFGLHDDIARAVAGSIQPDRAEWETAYARWRSALDRRDPVVEADRLSVLAVNKEGPSEILGRGRCQDFSPKWMSVDCLNNDVLLTDAEKQRLRETVEAWHIERGRLLEERCSSDEAEWSKLFDNVDEAEAALLEVAPPSAAELVLQQRLAGCRLSENDDDVSGGFDDLGWVSYNDEACWTRSPLTTLHRNTLRLAGIDHPMLHMERFSARGWIKAYESQGLMVSDSHRGLILTVHPDATADAAAARLRAELAETPWKFWAVKLTAHDRRETGGDPIYDSHMGAGHNDRRGGSSKFFGHVQLADLIEFTRAPDGTSPVPLVTRLDNREQG